MIETLKPPRRLANRVLVIVVLTAVAAATVLGWWAWRDYLPAVQFPGGAGIGMGSAPDRTALVVGLDGCLEGDGAARIIGVRPRVSTGGLRVTAFATNPANTDPVGTADQPVSRLNGYTDDRITWRCGGRSQSMAVQVIADTFPATARSFEVKYKVHGITRTATAEYNLTLYSGPAPNFDCQDDADLSPSGQADCEASSTN